MWQPACVALFITCAIGIGFTAEKLRKDNVWWRILFFSKRRNRRKPALLVKWSRNEVLLKENQN